ncbi:MAG: class I SAM-dependent methyltransferase [Candidatus Aminicenantales bacterium]
MGIPCIVRNPKRRTNKKDNSRASWFQYYASYSSDFVEDIISLLELSPNSKILDPWLGAGTTSEIAVAKGYNIKGFDINPAMLIVAKARLLPTSEKDLIPKKLESILLAFDQANAKINVSQELIEEPLEQWLTSSSAELLRTLEKGITFYTLKENKKIAYPIWNNLGQITPILAFFYVALFRTFRHYISSFQSSNPTWIKTAKGLKQISLSSDKLIESYKKETECLLCTMKGESLEMPEKSSRKGIIKVATSTNLPLPPESVDAVISSPPYCTRIDYVKATLPELAVINYPNGDVVRKLREKMIGTPVIRSTQLKEEKSWGETCTRFIVEVTKHPSKASMTYYLKYYQQYFSSLNASFIELNRVLKKGGKCVLVVQDSYYKEIHNDLPTIFIELAEKLKWKLDRRIDYCKKQTLAGVNRKVKPYRDFYHAKESVLFFSK